jgi:pantoate kinase
MKLQTNVKAGARDVTVNVNNTVTVNVTVGTTVTINDNSVNTAPV